jgi:diguanylate cyclase (GGDEF)-like protein/PAS domain S-box-containing protein
LPSETKPSQDTSLSDKLSSLQRLLQRYEQMINAASEGILLLNMNGKVAYGNFAAKQLLGLSKGLDPELELLDFVANPPDETDHALAYELISDALRNGTEVCPHEATFMRTDKGTFPVEFRCLPLINQDFNGGILTFRDISSRKLTEQELQNFAFFDQLTKLPNRTLFHDRLEQQIATAKRDQQKLALMFIDLDDFQAVNETLGFTAGDQFLRVVAQRLKDGSRKADTVARLGSDEFVWFGEIADQDDAELIARKLIELMARPVRLDQRNVCSTASVGIALFPDAADNAAALMSCADAAMHMVKQKSKNNFSFYRKSMRS